MEREIYMLYYAVTVKIVFAKISFRSNTSVFSIIKSQ